MEKIKLVFYIIWGLFTIIYLYQSLFMLIGIFSKKKKYPESKINHTFAILIAARNEEKVIANLLDSIRSQNFPQENVKIFIVADNCEDKTAEICRSKGAIVYERFNKEQIGKGYALNFLFKNIANDYKDYNPDAFFVFDADNVLSKNYIKEMNNALDAGVKVCTSYRNSKNFGTNWLSAGSSLGFMRECRFIHRPKSKLGLGTHVSGTGFYVSKDVLPFKDGWKYVTLTEDLEFSTSSTLKGVTIGYCENAVFYDEQPIKFKQTWKQRLRWSKGSLMVLGLFHTNLFVSFFKSFNFNFYEYFFSRCFPVSVFYGLLFIANNILSLISNVLNVVSGQALASVFLFLWPFLSALLTTYLGLLIDSLLITILEWKNIKAPWYKKIKYAFTSPIFTVVFSIFTSFVALFKKVKWEPIEHTQSVSQTDLEKIS